MNSYVPLFDFKYFHVFVVMETHCMCEILAYLSNKPYCAILICNSYVVF